MVGNLPVTEKNGKKNAVTEMMGISNGKFFVVNLSFPYAGIIQIRWF